MEITFHFKITMIDADSLSRYFLEVNSLKNSLHLKSFVVWDYLWYSFGKDLAHYF